MSEQGNALSVTDAVGIAKRALEDITVKVVGEVSHVSINSRYSAVYFTIKDEKSSLDCLMWNNRYKAADISLEEGQLVELVGRFTIYAAKGKMSFDVFSVELAGEGKLRMQVANLAKKLQAEGLMSPERKKRLPFYPERIGLVTSPRGAAVYDVLRTLRRRYPLAKVFFAGVLVEGAKAPSQIIEGLTAVEEAGSEVILLVRGGGSFEDLMPFNDEGLARKIASMSVPVVTGIGHEPDTSIADMVSDFRASTPTAAAENVAPLSLQVEESLAAAGERMSSMLNSRLSKTAAILQKYEMMPALTDPMRLFQNDALKLDELSSKLSTALPNYIANCAEVLKFSRFSLASSLSRLLMPYEHYLSAKTESYRVLGPEIVLSIASKLQLESARLEALSPLSVLTRGYSIAKKGNGEIVNSIEEVSIGDQLIVQVRDGEMTCDVRSAKREEYAMEDVYGW